MSLSVEVLDPRIQSIVSEHQTVELIADGFGFIEGPAWHPKAQHLTFSDITESRLYRWSEDAGLCVHRDPAGMANGNTYDKSGRLLSCEHATSRVAREDGEELDVIASHFQGRELNSPNDIVVRSDGMIYFTDPDYGRGDEYGVVREKQLDFQGVFQLHPVTLEITLLASDFKSPNGLCFGLDESELFVADTDLQHVRRFHVAENRLSGGEVFTESPYPDGLKIDSLGNLYAGGPEGVYVYDGMDATPLGVIHTPEFCANFAWGGSDLSELFLTASSGLYQTRVKVPGKALF